MPRIVSESPGTSPEPKTTVARGTEPPPLAAVPSVAPASARCVPRSRVYSFSTDESGAPMELGSGRFAKAYLGQERWIESKTTFTRPVAIKVLQKGVSAEDQVRFQLEKEILEHVQGHPNIVEIFASGEDDVLEFVPECLRDRIVNDFIVLELMDTSLEERLTGSRNERRRDDLTSVALGERLFRVLDYVLPVANAVEYAHLVRNTCHRDIKPANILLQMPNPALCGARMRVKLADFNVGKFVDPESNVSMTQFQAVPGTMYFQSPEQEFNCLELLVNVESDSPEVEFFEDFYLEINENDRFSLFNRDRTYKILGADRTRKRILLDAPYGEDSELNVRAKVLKSVGRPADIYSLGALFYYLISGAFGNPKALYDAFRKFVEYERDDETNTIQSYIDHEYGIIQNLRAPKTDEHGMQLAPEDRFFSYKHYLDGNGELIEPAIMTIIAKAMIRNKPDSYCQSWDLETTGISDLVSDLFDLYDHYGANPSARPSYQDRTDVHKPPGTLRRWLGYFGLASRT